MERKQFIGATGSRFLFAISLLLSGCVLAHAGSVPIALAGWNQDVIAQNTDSSPRAGTSTGVDVWSFYEAGAPTTSQGLPSTGLFTSASNPGVQFQLAPYNQNNALANSSVFLVSPTRYNSLSFLVTTLSGGYNDTASWHATLHFSDASTTTLGITIDPDWSNPGAGNAAISNVGAALRGNWGDFNYAAPLGMFEHDFTLSGSDATKTLSSIDFVTVSGVDTLLMAVSGTPAIASTPEPATLGLLSLGLISVGFAVTRKKLA